MRESARVCAHSCGGLEQVNYRKSGLLTSTQLEFQGKMTQSKNDPVFIQPQNKIFSDRSGQKKEEEGGEKTACIYNSSVFNGVDKMC